MAANSHSLRAATFHALARLSLSGYHAERICGKSRLFDIIAWNTERVMFLTVRTSRTRSLSRFSSDILNLCKLVHTHRVPGQIQFWLYCNAEWSQYQILTGGAMPVREAGL